jgi:tripartite-type tricarboxylate transporter receptor subunit TctC
MVKAERYELEIEVIKVAKSTVVKDELAQEYALAVRGAGAEYEAFIREEQARWKPVIQRAGIKPDCARQVQLKFSLTS